MASYFRHGLRLFRGGQRKVRQIETFYGRRPPPTLITRQPQVLTVIKTTDDENIDVNTCNSKLPNVRVLCTDQQGAKNEIINNMTHGNDSPLNTITGHVCNNTKRKRTVTSARALKLILMNSRSVCNKATLIFDYIIYTDADILFITETWLTDKKDVVLNDLVPSGYSFIRADRNNGRRGGGILVVFKEGLKMKKVKTRLITPSFESLEGVLRHENRILRFLTIYRPPSSSKNNTSPRQFLDEFQNFFLELPRTDSNLFVLGDINLHVNDEEDSVALDFMKIMESFDLRQHVIEPTHNGGNILDLVFTPSNDDLLKELSVQTNHISDHESVIFLLDLKKPKSEKRVIEFRDYGNFNTKLFQEELYKCDLTKQIEATSKVDEKMKIFNKTIAELLDIHAPLKTKVICNRPNTKWYTCEIADLKRKRRKAEDVWRKKKSPESKSTYTKFKNETNKAIILAKRKFIRKSIEDCNGDTKKLFKEMNNLVKPKSFSRLLPEHACLNELTEKFNKYFNNKIHSIRDKLDEYDGHNMGVDIDMNDQAIEIQYPLLQFAPLSQSEVMEIIQKSPNKMCQLDVVPTQIIKSCAIPLLPSITSIINCSMANGDFPESLKKAFVTPLLKKTNLDPENLKNFRPVSNLNFVSKLIEKAVVKRLSEHLKLNNISMPFQSAYKSAHSTETALLRVLNDVIHCLSHNNNVILILLDLSAAFDTVDHPILLRRMKQMFGVMGSALSWFEAYLAGRSQQVLINNISSSPSTLEYGVPQGSVLGPFLFTLYMAPLVKVVSRHGLMYHMYADDTQLYVPISPQSLATTIESVNNTTKAIKSWMSRNKLQLNGEKTELISFRKKGSELIADEILVDGNAIKNSSVVRNLGFYFDEHLTMNNHVTKVCQSMYYHISNVSRIRDLLDIDSAKLLVHSLVTSRLDYCNSLLQGTPKFCLSRLQKMQNKAARVIMKSKPREHVTPILRQLHWLPVRERIEYKIACLTYQCIHDDNAPDYLKSLIEVYKPTRTLRSSNSMNLVVPFPKTLIFNRTFSFAAPHIWNSLSLKTKCSPSIISFRKNLKTELFKQAF